MYTTPSMIFKNNNNNNNDLSKGSERRLRDGRKETCSTRGGGRVSQCTRLAALGHFPECEGKCLGTKRRKNLFFFRWGYIRTLMDKVSPSIEKEIKGQRELHICLRNGRIYCRFYFAKNYSTALQNRR